MDDVWNSVAAFMVCTLLAVLLVSPFFSGWTWLGFGIGILLMVVVVRSALGG